MPKSRNRRRNPRAPTRKVKLAPEAMEAIEGQLERFRQKFGRDPGPNDPIFFDPDADEPVQISGVRMQADILEALRKAGAPPEIAYAYRKTGLLSLGGDMSLWPKDHIEEWEAAVAEYHLIEQAKREAGPKPEGWNTEIPELLISDFSEEDFAHVRACLSAMAPVEGARPMKLVARIELPPRFWPRPAGMPTTAPMRPGTRTTPRISTIGPRNWSYAGRANSTPKDLRTRPLLRWLRPVRFAPACPRSTPRRA
jgi:hypothetical protein